MLISGLLVAALVGAHDIELVSPADAQPPESLERHPPQPTGVRARFFHGQTFVAWREVASLVGEHYRVYRHDAPITAANLGDATLLQEVWEGSSIFWADRWRDNFGQFSPRWSATLPFAPETDDVGEPLSEDEGLLVWTLHDSDLPGGPADAYYAVTCVTRGGAENEGDFGPGNTAGPVAEAVLPPRPVKLLEGVGSNGSVHRVYVQFMDLTRWNETLAAPNAVHISYGQDLSARRIRHATQYAYSYVVIEPVAAPEDYPLAVMVKLHPFLSDRIAPGSAFTAVTPGINSFGYLTFPAIEVRPIDVGSTWWFGNAAKGFDYRAFADECEAIEALGSSDPPVEIVNYTEQRVLRMVDELLSDPYSLAGAADAERVYVAGYSMGGSGTLSLALRYPEVFAGAYSAVPITDFASIVDPAEGCTNPSLPWPANPDCFLGLQLDLAFDVALKWGPSGSGSDPMAHVYPGRCSFANPPAATLPVRLEGPTGGASELSAHDGTPVYEWQDLVHQLGEVGAGDVAPLVVRHSSIDHIASWPLQGKPVYAALNAAGIVSGGLVDDVLDHLPWWYLAMPEELQSLPGEGPFFGLRAVRSETVPGLRLLELPASGWTLPPPDAGVHAYNVVSALPAVGEVQVAWSSSWNAWDGPPVDTPGLWKVSLRALGAQPVRADVVPRRLQSFSIAPGGLYGWELANLADEQIACGCAVADGDGLLVIPDLEISTRGVRLSVVPGAWPGCGDCLGPVAVEEPDSLENP